MDSEVSRETARQDNGQFGVQPLAEAADVELTTPIASRRAALDSMRLGQRELSLEIDRQMSEYADLLHTVDMVEGVIDEDGDFPSNGRYLVLSSVVPRDLRYRASVVTPDGEERELRTQTVIFMTNSQVVPATLRANTDEMTGPYAGVLVGRDDHVIDLDKYRDLDLQTEADRHHAALAMIALGKTTVISVPETSADIRDFIDRELDDSFDNEPMVAMSPEHRAEAVRRALEDPSELSRVFHEQGYEAYGDEIRNKMRAVFDEHYDIDDLYDRHDAGEFQ